MTETQTTYPAEFDIVVIGGSLGSFKPLQAIVARLPVNFPCPLVVALHRSDAGPDYRPHFFGLKSRLCFKSAQQGAWLNPGCVYFAPPGTHVAVAPPGRCLVELATGGGFRPSVDSLFDSAARTFGSRALGVILSGRLYDGATGALAIRNKGGVVIAQNPNSCGASSMPESVLANGSANYSLAPDIIAHALVSLAMMPGARALFGAASIAA